MQLADIVLIEADGSRRMPCKVPAAHEPVLLPQCDIVLAVAGVSALGESLEKGCFRAELAQQILRVPGNAVLTPTLLAKLLGQRVRGEESGGGAQLLCSAQSGRHRRAGRVGPPDR